MFKVKKGSIKKDNNICDKSRCHSGGEKTCLKFQWRIATLPGMDDASGTLRKLTLSQVVLITRDLREGGSDGQALVGKTECPTEKEPTIYLAESEKPKPFYQFKNFNKLLCMD